MMVDEKILKKWWEDSHIIDVQQQSPSISKVPKLLKGTEKDEIYTPEAICFGPYHFLAPDLAEMEREKSIIISCTKVRELFDDFLRPDQVVGQIGEHPWHKESLKPVLTKCQDAYGDHPKQFKDEEFFLMMVRDTSFLLLFLAAFVGLKDEIVKDDITPFKDLGCGEGHNLEVMKDVVKLENQLPLAALEALYHLVVDSQKSFRDFLAMKCSFYCPVWIPSTKALDSLDASNTHLLGCVHQVCVYEVSEEFGHKGSSPIAWIKKRLSWKGCFPITWIKKRLMRNNVKKHKKSHPTRLAGSRVLPSAVKLRKAGVKFKDFEGGIKNIKFVREDGTLYLPVMKVGSLTESVMRNLIAFELSSAECKEKAVTSFVRLLDELIEDAKDVELLRKSGILVNLDGRDEKMVSILKSLRRSTWKPYFQPINVSKSNLHKFYNNQKLRILWSEFLEANCSKPWIVVSGVAAIALLLMTVAQVVCLFYTCNP